VTDDPDPPHCATALLCAAVGIVCGAVVMIVGLGIVRWVL